MGIAIDRFTRIAIVSLFAHLALFAVAPQLSAAGPTTRSGGHAVSQYATTVDLALRVNPSLLTGIDAPTQNAALVAASGLIDAALGNAYTLPLISWGQDLTSICCDLTKFMLLERRGYNPEAGADVLIQKQNDAALKWLDLVATGKRSSATVVDSAPGGAGDEGPMVLTSPQRGLTDASQTAAPDPFWDPGWDGDA